MTSLHPPSPSINRSQQFPEGQNDQEDGWGTYPLVCVIVATMFIIVSMPFSMLSGKDMVVSVSSHKANVEYRVKNEVLISGDYSVMEWHRLCTVCPAVDVVRADFTTRTYADKQIIICFTGMSLRYAVVGGQILILLFSFILICSLSTGASKPTIALLCVANFIVFLIEAFFATGIALGTNCSEYLLLIRSKLWILSTLFLLFALVIYAAAAGAILVGDRERGQQKAKPKQQQQQQFLIVSGAPRANTHGVPVQPAMPGNAQIESGMTEQGIAAKGIRKKSRSPENKPRSHTKGPNFSDMYYQSRENSPGMSDENVLSRPRPHGFLHESFEDSASSDHR